MRLSNNTVNHRVKNLFAVFPFQGICHVAFPVPILLFATILLTGCMRDARNSHSLRTHEFDTIINGDTIYYDDDTLITTNETTNDLSVVIVGNTRLDNVLWREGEKGGRQNDYDDLFYLIRPQITSADISIANIEITPDSHPLMSSLYENPFLKSMSKAGFDILSISYKPVGDYNSSDRERIIQSLDSLGLFRVGIHFCERNQRVQNPLIVEKNGIRIGFLTFSNINKDLASQSDLSYGIDTVEIASQVAMALSQKCDVIIALPQWKKNYSQTVTDDQKKTVDWLLSNGVDHVIGSQTDMIQPMELRTDEKGNHIVVYSLGNFVSHSNNNVTDGGLTIRMKFVKSNRRTSLALYGYTLNWLSRPSLSGKERYTLIPSGYPEHLMSSKERFNSKAFYESTRQFLEKNNRGFKEYDFWKVSR